MIDASARDRITTLYARLSTNPYGPGADEFVRFQVDANDDVVAGVLRAAIAEGDQGCEVFRRGLDQEGSQALQLFASRRTLQGRRQSSLGLLFEALDAWALMTNDHDVPWDTWLKANLFIARSLGGDPGAIASRFGDLADGDSAMRFDVALEAMNRVTSLEQCHVAEVTTDQGVGFVEMLVFRDATRGGISRAPKLGANVIEFQPRSNLAQLAVSLANALDDSRKAVTGPLRQDQLPATCFSLSVSGSYVGSTGCLSFVADGVEGETSYTAYVAELPEDTDVEALADAAVDTDDQAAVYDHDRLLLFSPLPSFDEVDDTVPNFDEVELLAREILDAWSK
ncbi:MAG: hypothetical protein WA786_08735 [Acidimicrobiales bacterium]